MRPANPKLLSVIGFSLVLLGMVLPYLMVMRFVEPTYFLSFLSWSATTSGLFLGFIGAATAVRMNRK